MSKNKKINIYKKKYPKKTDNIKKISVIIPNYNYEQFLNERIDSVLLQTYPIHELIILDDKSTDNSVKLINKKIKKIKNIKVKVILNEKNSGSVFAQWQKGLKEVTGDYFWIAESDDSCDPKFLETAMKSFDDKDVVISYTESARIDSENNIISKNSQDLYNIFNTKKYDKTYINDGKNEIKKYLSVTNTILNVSSVVWKYNDYTNIFEKAKEFIVAGDWFIYYNVLKTGKIAFSPEPLNYYRKHGSSVCTDVKADIEYKEICKIQEMANKEYKLGMDIYKLQRLRRSYMEHNVSKNIRKKRIAWVIPHPGKGSGGHRTIIQNVNALIRHGYECDIYVEEDWISTNLTVASKIDEYYEICAANVYVGIKPRIEYDMVFATGWSTINFVKVFNAPIKSYFIQDFEPWFFPMGDGYLITEDSYRLEFNCITIGKWLTHKMITEYNSPSQYFDFCADLNIYKPLENVVKEDAICFIWQPEKPRRCDKIALDALKLVKNAKPDIKIYVYGSNTENQLDFPAERLGIIPINECNELYNKCKVGLCMSASNPSRIPFEMMAAGLPVVEMYKENNLYDFPDGGVLLAQSSSEAIATAIINLLDNPEKRKKMSKFGIEYMKKYPLEKGFEQFIEAVDNVLIKDKTNMKDIDLLYTEKPVLPSNEIKKLSSEILKIEPAIDNRTKMRKKMTKIKNKIKMFIRSIGWKFINFSEKL